MAHRRSVSIVLPRHCTARKMVAAYSVDQVQPKKAPYDTYVFYLCKRKNQILFTERTCNACISHCNCISVNLWLSGANVFATCTHAPFKACPGMSVAWLYIAGVRKIDSFCFCVPPFQRSIATFDCFIALPRCTHKSLSVWAEGLRPSGFCCSYIRHKK